MAAARRGGPTAGEGMARRPATTPGGASWPATRSGPSLASGLGRRLPSLLGRLGEAIAHAEHRLDVLLADLLADVLDVGVDRALVRLEGHTPHRIEQLGSREHAARLTRHQSHDLELALGQVDAAAGEAGLHPWHVQLDVRADADHV